MPEEEAGVVEFWLVLRVACTVALLVFSKQELR